MLQNLESLRIAINELGLPVIEPVLTSIRWVAKRFSKRIKYGDLVSVQTIPVRVYDWWFPRSCDSSVTIDTDVHDPKKN
uniref:Uncharacterized protein n=1 Tax=Trichobilharzia regenti TaxID=157069 RepID=A0AA85ITZ2_TRIRE|nr:unnamed protein product [Trichobilharzia regenti]